MTFDPSIPLASDPPGNFPTQSQTNFSRLKTLISADHQFNNTAATDDGYHNIVHLTAQTPNAAAVPASGRLYAKADGLGRLQVNYMDDTPGSSLNYQVTPSMPIRAAVNFSAPTSLSLAVTVESSYNVASVVNVGIPGQYDITFTNAMPDKNYIVQITGQMNAAAVGGSNGPIIGSINPDTSYPGTMATENTLRVYFTKIDGISISPLRANVTIFSVT